MQVNGISTSTGSGSTSLGAQLTQTQTPVFSEYGSLDAAISSLGERVSILAERLGPVLADVAGKSVETGTPEASLSPFASRIRDDRRRINYIEDRIGEILSRLEL